MTLEVTTGKEKLLNASLATLLGGTIALASLNSRVYIPEIQRAKIIEGQKTTYLDGFIGKDDSLDLIREHIIIDLGGEYITSVKDYHKNDSKFQVYNTEIQKQNTK